MKCEWVWYACLICICGWAVGATSLYILCEFPPWSINVYHTPVHIQHNLLLKMEMTNFFCCIAEEVIGVRGPFFFLLRQPNIMPLEWGVNGVYTHTTHTHTHTKAGAYHNGSAWCIYLHCHCWWWSTQNMSISLEIYYVVCYYCECAANCGLCSLSIHTDRPRTISTRPLVYQTWWAINVFLPSSHLISSRNWR